MQYWHHHKKSQHYGVWSLTRHLRCAVNKPLALLLHAFGLTSCLLHTLPRRRDSPKVYGVSPNSQYTAHDCTPAMCCMCKRATPDHLRIRCSRVDPCVKGQLLIIFGSNAPELIHVWKAWQWFRTGWYPVTQGWETLIGNTSPKMVDQLLSSKCIAKYFNPPTLPPSLPPSLLPSLPLSFPPYLLPAVRALGQAEAEDHHVRVLSPGTGHDPLYGLQVSLNDVRILRSWVLNICERVY